MCITTVGTVMCFNWENGFSDVVVPRLETTSPSRRPRTSISREYVRRDAADTET